VDIILHAQNQMPSYELQYPRVTTCFPDVFLIFLNTAASYLYEIRFFILILIIVFDANVTENHNLHGHIKL
jgi:hypothetical protein